MQGAQTAGGSNVADFPPLGLGRNGTNAEPMQVERAKMRAPSRSSSNSVWNGNGSTKSVQGDVGYFPYPMPSNQSSPTDIPLPTATPQPQNVAAVITAPEHDVDFPRRVPSIRSAANLYDPATLPAQNVLGPSSRSNTTVASIEHDSASGEVEKEGVNAQDLIEAKLAALSVSAGISIGPPPVKAIVTSYAKIVRRD